MYYGQYEQDRFLHEKIFKKYMEQPGFFIEIGADDGIRFSNTLFFERELKWQGICIEPKPSVFSDLKLNRKCLCINQAISLEEGQVEFMEIVGYGRQLSGILSNYNKEHLERIEKETQSKDTISKEIIKVDSVPLSQVMASNNIKQVNFLSIDTEGSEIDILESINFDEVTIDAILIENNYGDDYLKMNKYLSERYQLFDSIHHDQIYVAKHITAKYL